jgi:VWA domain-containing protein/fibronectin type III domain protein
VIRLRSRASSVAATLVVAMLLVIGGLVPTARAAADPSDVVIVLDFSASILKDSTNRNRFGAALERIADRVDATSADLVAGDVTVSIVQFASTATDVRTCVDLKLLGNATQVGHFADCLRLVAAAYRKGLSPALEKKIGIDTNYVAAMQRAAVHLPADSERPALILFTDGKHDAPGVPVSQVQTTLQQLFGSRSPFALLPVGMGLAPSERATLAAGLEALRVTRDMPACVSGATFDWPTVVFETADAAGNAVAVALQDATCTYTVGPTPSPSPTPTPLAIPILGLKVTPGDGSAAIAWTAAVPGASAPPVSDWQARCTAPDGTVVESSEGISTETTATVSGLTNGTSYQCEVAAVTGTTVGPWVPAGSVTPLGRPASPAKPGVSALNQAIQVAITPVQGSSGYTVECSSDNGATWPIKVDTSAGTTSTVIDQLTNGTSYVCRAFAANAIGVSDASQLSDPVKPCNSLIECNSASLPIFGGLAALLFIGVIVALIALVRGRTTGYVIAVVDVVHTANIGHGAVLGISFVREPGSRDVTGIVADLGKGADVRIQRRRDGGFLLRDRSGKREVADGDPVVVTDGHGTRHSLVLRAFETNAASRVATRR